MPVRVAVVGARGCDGAERALVAPRIKEKAVKRNI